MSSLPVLTLGTGSDGRGAALWLAGRGPATGSLEPGWAQRVAEAVARALQPPPGLLLAGSDVQAAQAERRAAEHLAGLVDGPGMAAVRDALVALRARDGRLELVLDCRRPELRALPWELLAGLPPGRSPLACERLLRLQDAEPRAVPAASGTVRVRLWAPDVADPASAQAVARVEALVHAHPGLVLERVPADPSQGAPAHPGPAVLHVVAHGHAAGAGASAVGLHGGDRVRAAETVRRSLEPWLAGCVLAVADVCGGAAGTADPADAPVWRLALDGPPVVAGPRTRWAVEASAAFTRALYPALLAGETAVQAVDAGRQALRHLALAHESARWWTPVCILATPLAAGLRLAPPALRLPGLPVAAPDALPVLQRAAALARGHLGVEHLLAALGEHAWPLAPAFAAVAAGRPPLPLAGESLPTPRLQALGAALPQAFPLRALAQAVALVPWVARDLDPAARARLLAPDEDDGRGTLPIEIEGPALDAAGPHLLLEVEGGPEDGEVVALRSPGEVLGRWDPGRPELRAGRLYRDRSDGDRTLSRQHLVLVQGHRVDARGATRLQRPGQAEQLVRGPVDLSPGDRLVVGAVTRLRVLG